MLNSTFMMGLSSFLLPSTRTTFRKVTKLVFDVPLGRAVLPYSSSMLQTPTSWPCRVRSVSSCTAVSPDGPCCSGVPSPTGRPPSTRTTSPHTGQVRKNRRCRYWQHAHNAQRQRARRRGSVRAWSQLSQVAWVRSRSRAASASAASRSLRSSSSPEESSALENNISPAAGRSGAASRTRTCPFRGRILQRCPVSTSSYSTLPETSSTTTRQVGPSWATFTSSSSSPAGSEHHGPHSRPCRSPQARIPPATRNSSG
mmetsp:Transcript_17175/g.37881  ORF Transcript_17175/g.37881 Transcript_17175/m.37881 type:complete len:256 (-) Transcript_17175:1822-2589(-)